MAWIETNTLSNQNISSALAIGAYTATFDGLIIADFSADQVAGNGDYVAYITRQINGAGSAYVVLPKTTMTAASGETAISGQSGIISVRSGDILTVYLDGLAGDTTTPDTIVRWYSVGVRVDAITDGVITAAAIATGAIDADALAADAGTEIGTAVWSSATRTLTQTAQDISDTVEGSAITLHRGDTWSKTLTDLPANTDYVSIDLTVKASLDDSDDDAILRIRLNASTTDDGLLRLNGAAPVAPVVDTDGSITVNSSTSLTFALAARASDDLAIKDGYYYDVQYIFAGSVQTATYGIFNVSGDVTRSVS